MDRPREHPVGFRRHLRAEVVPGEATYLLSAHGVTAVQGRYVEALAPLLDGTRTLRAVLNAVEPTVPAAEAARVLGQLARANLVGYHVSSTDDAAAHAYWDLAGLDGNASAQELSSTPVAVLTAGAMDAAEARAACRASGLTVCDAGDPERAFSLVLCDDYLSPELAEIDAAHRAAGRSWLLAKPCGAQPWVGPVFRPGSSEAGPCWSCLAQRLRAHRRSEVPVQRALGLTGPVPRPEASLAAGRALGLHSAVLEAAKWLAGVREANQESVCTLDTLTLRTRHHVVRRRPQCPECGDPGAVAARVLRPVVPQSRPKAAYEGGDRALTPQQMLRRYGHLVSPLTGIVSELRQDTRLPEELNCFVSAKNAAMEAHSLRGLRGGLRSHSGGKGVTALEAEVGALCEAAERFCSTRQGDEPTIRDTFAGLGRQAVHPNACQLFADRQFRDRKRWNARHSAFHQVCAPFRTDVPVDWTPAWSLTAGEHRLLPTSMLYYGPGPGGCPNGPWADSNGNAAGSSPEDAIVQGFLEVVERDAVALWWYNRTRHPAVCLDSFDEPWLDRARRAYGRMHREVWVLDVTSDLGIPVMAAVSRRTDKPAEDIVLGFGAHFDPRIALRRALTEMCQLLPAVAAVTSDGAGYAVRDPEPMSWWRGATVENQPYLLPDPAEQPRSPGSFAFTPRFDLRQDIEAAEAIVRAHAMELIVLDQTRPDVEIPVVKVIVPGLRHFWTRFAPGRLFDIPVQLGRRDIPTRYEDLNPVPLFV